MRKFIVLSIVLLVLVGFAITSSAVPPVVVAVDIKPESCPNPLNVKDKGVLSVAIRGTVHIDVNDIDPATVLLEGVVSPLRWDLEDVAEPFEPFTGKEDCMLDCHELGPDGVMDLTLKFDVQEIITALGAAAEDGACLTLHLTGDFYDGVHFIHGEDLIIIIKKGKP